MNPRNQTEVVAPMNGYGRRALEHWRRWRPTQFSTISDPEVFFSTLGETAATQVEALTDQLAGPDEPDESTLDKMGRLGMAKHRAEEMVLPETVYPEPEPGTDESEDIPPDAWAVEWAMEEQRFRQQLQEELEREYDRPQPPRP